ncbi:MAG: hypothetical protein EKK55_01815 [Rhodocyclaceae bacterium]|nr:MAG: hypothetical protein EKK55_01815 [Rhodocyclaceae bacterium]
MGALPHFLIAFAVTACLLGLALLTFIAIRIDALARAQSAGRERAAEPTPPPSGPPAPPAPPAEPLVGPCDGCLCTADPTTWNRGARAPVPPVPVVFGERLDEEQVNPRIRFLLVGALAELPGEGPS